MSQSSRYLIAAIAVAILGTASGLFYVFRDDLGGSEKTVEAQVGLCSEHGVPEKTCPFCHPDLVKTMGQCAEHDVPEALCYECRPELVAGFKATHDWCGEHGVPDSWCPLCGGSPPAPSSGASSEKPCKEHDIRACPFCQPDLVKTIGQCAEHDVPEALCYQCRPELVAAFKAKHDWCSEHGVPESWCPL